MLLGEAIRAAAQSAVKADITIGVGAVEDVNPLRVTVCGITAEAVQCKCCCRDTLIIGGESYPLRKNLEKGESVLAVLDAHRIYVLGRV